MIFFILTGGDLAAYSLVDDRLGRSTDAETSENPLDRNTARGSDLKAENGQVPVALFDWSQKASDIDSLRQTGTAETADRQSATVYLGLY